MSDTSVNIKGDMLMVSVALFAAFGWLFSQQALLSFSPFWFLALRFLSAGIIVSIIGYKALSTLSLKQWWIALRLGFLMAVALLLWVTGLSHSKHLGESAFIASLAVIYVPIMGRFIYGTKITRSLLVPLVLAIVGLIVLMLKNGFSLETSQIYLLVAAVIFASHFVVTANVVRSMPAIVITATQMTCVGLVALVMALVTEPMLNLSVGIVAWQWMVWSIFVASLMRFAIQTYAMKLTSANNAGMVLVLEPVFTVLIASWYLNESLALNQWIGCGLIFSAIVVYQYLRHRETRILALTNTR
ncbi:MAG: DMT family transporter [Cellvibrionaceae bacterium]